MDKRPIGIFDSGVGGLSILKAVQKRLPQERLVYFADQAHVPYGIRPLEEIRHFSEAITRFLFEEHVKMVVVACNTASGAALHYIRDRFPHEPIIGLEPAITPAARVTVTSKIAVLATKATLQGELYLETRRQLASKLTVHEATLEGIVEEIEAGRIDSDLVQSILMQYIPPLVEKGVDTYVLGCTHYPFVCNQIREIAGPDINIIDPADRVAEHIARTLEKRKLLAPPQQPGAPIFYSTKEPDKLVEISKLLTGLEGKPVHAFWETGRIQATS